MLIELRLRPVQERLKRTTWSAALRCRIPPRCVHRVPHLSLYTPDVANLGQVAAVRQAVNAACRGHRYLDCTIDGYGRGNGQEGHFVYYRVVPSDELVEFRRDLARRLASICPSPKRFESPGADFLFHITVAYRLSQRQADRLWQYLNGREASIGTRRGMTGLLGWLRRLLHLGSSPHPGLASRVFRIPLRVVRVSFIGNDQRIVCEYDLPGQRMLSRREALDRRGWRCSIETARALRK